MAPTGGRLLASIAWRVVLWTAWAGFILGGLFGFSLVTLSLIIDSHVVDFLLITLAGIIGAVIGGFCGLLCGLPSGLIIGRVIAMSRPAPSPKLLRFRLLLIVSATVITVACFRLCILWLFPLLPGHSDFGVGFIDIFPGMGGAWTGARAATWYVAHGRPAPAVQEPEAHQDEPQDAGPDAQ